MQSGKKASKKLVDVSKPPSSVPQEPEYVGFCYMGLSLFLFFFTFRFDYADGCWGFECLLPGESTSYSLLLC